jgi:hypothetical protein
LSETRKLRGWIGKQGEEARYVSSRAVNSLSKVARRMAGSISHLEGKRVRQALDAQSKALDELARLRDDLKRGDEVAAPLESRPLVLQGRVELPDPNDYQVPPEFRDDILEAMRDELPTQYKKAIRQYYKTLVK